MGLRTNWCAAPFLVGENLHLERGDGQQSLTDSWKEILEDPEIQIVIEVMVESSLPEPISRRHFTPVSNSFTLISNSLQRGKSNEISGKSFPHFHFETVLLLIPRNIS